MEENQKKLQELQFLEQNLQNILMQKQAFQLELSETESSLDEILNYSDKPVYKLIGEIILETSKDKVKDELEKKKGLIDMRLKSLDNQENMISEKISALRDALTSK